MMNDIRMRKISAGFTSIRFSRIVLLSVTISGIFALALWNKAAVDQDFRRTIKLLSNVRYDAIQNDRVMIAKFIGKSIVVSDATGNVIQLQDIPTLAEVNYDTTLGNDMIVFSGNGTSRHNKRVHGGDLTFRSWLGFERSIHVNCTGLAREGWYPAE